MRRHTVDFLHPQPGPRLGWVLLIVGSLCIATSLWLVQRWRMEGLAQQQLRMERDAAARVAAKPIRIAPPSPEQRRLRQAEMQIARAWLPALRAIESATADPVYLLSMNMESASGSVSISGEAPSLDDALGFARRVNDSEALSSAMLASHEQTSDAQTGRQFVRFKLTAQWPPR